jgi:hypothetical protein
MLIYIQFSMLKLQFTYRRNPNTVFNEQYQNILKAQQNKQNNQNNIIIKKLNCNCSKK